MPWLETDPVTERERLILEAEGGLLSLAELCRRYKISRKTGYKCLERYRTGGPTKPWIRATGYGLRSLHAPLPLNARDTRLPRPLRGPQGLDQRRDPVALRLGPRQASARRREHRTRGSRPRRLDRLPRTGHLRLAPRPKGGHSRSRRASRRGTPNDELSLRVPCAARCGLPRVGGNHNKHTQLR